MTSSPVINPGAPDAPPPRAHASGERSVAVGGNVGGDVITGDTHVGVPWQALVAAVLGMALLGGVAFAAYPRLAAMLAQPRQMAGNLNIAVARFGVLNANDRATASSRATDLSNHVHAELLGKLNDPALGLDARAVEVWSPDQTEGMYGSAAERARAAQQRAEAINADVLIYGNVRSEADLTTFVPEFYIAPNKLRGAEELAGSYEVGAPVRSAGEFSNPATFDDLRARLVRRTTPLVPFMFGLGEMARGDYRAAEGYFNQAVRQGWSGQDANAVVALFLGNTAGHQRDWARANDAFAQALALDRNFGRARLAIAVVQFQTAGAQHGCAAASIDEAQLREALASFDLALRSDGQPAVSNVQAKGHLARGQALVCLAEAQREDAWDAAASDFRFVVADFERGNVAIQRLAYEAHAGLGFVAFRQADAAADPDAQLRVALREFERAVELAQPRRDVDDGSYRVRRATFSVWVGDIQTHLGDRAAADRAYDQAQRWYEEALAVAPANNAEIDGLVAQLRERRSQ